MRVAANITDDLAARLDAHVQAVGTTHSLRAFTRADAVRSAMRYYLDAVAPPPPEFIEGTAVEIVDGLALPKASAPVLTDGGAPGSEPGRGSAPVTQKAGEGSSDE